MSDDKCPVDHTKRAAWMEKMGGALPVPPPEPEQPLCPVDHLTRSTWMSNLPLAKTSVPEAVEVDKGCSSETLADDPSYKSKANLPTEREVSSIPRTDTRANWIYPSQKQFYEAMKRKNWSPEATDMQTVVPIHNHVNELAWRNILNWERAYLDECEAKCGGISLTSFKGDLKKLTPRAWFKLAVLGQEKPFDRHDWLVDRCGIEVPYVIDFYGTNAGVYVDARPKVNSWEGLKLRVNRAFGWA